MATRGRKPKPSALKEAQGNPGRRPLNEREPKPSTSNIRPPEGIGEKAREVWERRVPMLIDMGVMTDADVPLVRNMCELEILAERALTDYREAKQRFHPKGFRRMKLKDPETGGEVTTDVPTGMELIPAAKEYTRLLELQVRIWAELGMTPSSRARLDVDAAGGGAGDPEDPDSKDSFLDNGHRPLQFPKAAG